MIELFGGLFMRVGTLFAMRRNSCSRWTGIGVRDGPEHALYLNAAFLGDTLRIFSGRIFAPRDGMLFSLPAGTRGVGVRKLQ